MVKSVLTLNQLSDPMLLQPFSIPAAYEKWGKYPFKSVLDDQQQLKTKAQTGWYLIGYTLQNM